MRTLLHTEFTALLARASLTQAAFARATGYTVQQVNAWCRGRGPIPRWAALLAEALQEIAADELQDRIEEEDFAWYEVLGVSPDADRATLRRARAALGTRHHPDKGGDHALMQRINAAYDDGTAGR